MPILATKLHIPHRRAQIVERPQLMSRLESSVSGKVSLISAPAGFGKSTLISEWVTASNRPTAWLSLDSGDSDPISFLIYVVAALDTIFPQIGESMAGLMQLPQPPPIETVLANLINTLASIKEAFILVLDDYHILDNEAIDRAMNFLIDHMPQQMHLVIATREDPQLPLARLRARGQTHRITCS